MMQGTIEITSLTKAGGPLTKKISLSQTGKSVVSDGSACVMSKGLAKRVVLNNLVEFAQLIGTLGPNEAIALGALRFDLQDRVKVTTQVKLRRLNGTAPLDLIARTSNFISYKAGHTALALIDIDTKGMPDIVRQRIEEVGGYWNALVTVLPELASAGRVERRSTTTGLSRSDTGEKFPGSEGRHIYILAEDGVDVDRFLRTLHDRCWIHGFGWHMVGAGGALLERSIVDRMVGMPERLVFEGHPVLIAPLTQDLALRQPQTHDGTPLNMREICPPLSIVEKSELDQLHKASRYRLAPESVKAREEFIAKHADSLAQRAGISVYAARRIIAQQCDGFLLPDIVLPWDDTEFDGCTVADILADPARFAGATLADPLEGGIYGRTKAMVMRHADGTPWINSFAHGRTTYELRYDARTIKASIEKADKDEVVEIFSRMASMSNLPQDELETLRNEVSKIAGVGRRTLDKRIKQTQNENARTRAKEEKDRRAAERLDRRPQIPAPKPDAPWLPQMQVLNDVLGSVDVPEPPMRDVDGAVTQVRVRRIPNMHALTSNGTNEDEAAETRLPAPEQPLLTRPDEAQVAEMIERYIDYVDETGRSVHLAGSFVKHFQNRSDDVLPVVAGIATLPIVLEDGTLLASRGLDRQRGLVFRIPPELCALMPKPEACTELAVAEAMRFLTDEFLADVATDYIGKCTLLALALTVIERALLPERPTFFVKAGRRGGGKTTTIMMILMAVTGARPSAAAWSTAEEERRKALISYLMEAVPTIVWDNIPRGTQISCPHIEKACTTAHYSDRKLGFNELLSVAASSIHVFTGNNIAPKGDLASRSLQIRLEVDRADPENRPFKHPDPVGWTEANRGRILKALYTIMLGNPALKSKVAPQTRFKKWWTLAGSAIENAARVAVTRGDGLVDDAPVEKPVQVDFRKLFLEQEDEEEENNALGDGLTAIAGEYPDGKEFQSADIARLLNIQANPDDELFGTPNAYLTDEEKKAKEAQIERRAAVRELLYPKSQGNVVVTPKGVSKRLKSRQDEPVRVGEQTLCLKARADNHTKVGWFSVHIIAAV